MLRLDANPRAMQAAASRKQLPQLDLSKKEGLGNVEESVIGKYGDVEDEGAEEDEEEE